MPTKLLLPAFALLLLTGCDAPKAGSGDTGKAVKASTATAKATAKPTAKAETTAAKTTAAAADLTIDQVCGLIDSYKKMESAECQDCEDDQTDGAIAPCKLPAKAVVKCVGGEKGLEACDEQCDDPCMEEDSKCCKCEAECYGKKDEKCQQQFLAYKRCYLSKCEAKCK